MILREVCLNNTAQQLKEIAKNNGLSGYSKMKKAELVDLIADHLGNYNTIEESLLLADEKEFECFRDVCNGQKSVLEEDATDYVFFFMRGYYMINNEKEISVPDDIRRLFPIITNAEFMKKRTHFQTILNYCKACVNLYGIVPIDHVCKLYNQSQKNEISNEDIIDVITKMQSKGCVVELRKNELIHELLLSNDKAYNLLCKKQEGKPFYIPAKKKILNYADDAYTEKNEYYNDMASFLKSSMLMSDEMAESACYEIECLYGQNLDAHDIAKELEKAGLTYTDSIQKAAFISHIMAYTNHIRLWEYRGNTKAELGLASVPSNVVNVVPETKTVHVAKKVGRNDPCPCGSGRKYKHCCGK